MVSRPKLSWLVGRGVCSVLCVCNENYLLECKGLGSFEKRREVLICSQVHGNIGFSIKDVESHRDQCQVPLSIVTLFI